MQAASSGLQRTLENVRHELQKATQELADARTALDEQQKASPFRRRPASAPGLGLTPRPVPAQCQPARRSRSAGVIGLFVLLFVCLSVCFWVRCRS